jgi:hypothetical protein
LQRESQVALRDLCQSRPLRQGLAELVAYLEVGREGGGQFEMWVDESLEDVISWRVEGEDRIRRARLPRIIYLRSLERGPV